MKVIVKEELREKAGCYTGDLLKGKVYDAVWDDENDRMRWLKIIDESGEDYVYPPEMFEIVEE